MAKTALIDGFRLPLSKRLMYVPVISGKECHLFLCQKQFLFLLSLRIARSESCGAIVGLR